MCEIDLWNIGKFVSIVLDTVADLKSEKCYPKENICKDCIS